MAIPVIQEEISTRVTCNIVPSTISTGFMYTFFDATVPPPQLAQYTDAGYVVIRKGGYIEDLFLSSNISSIALAPIPPTNPSMNDAEKWTTIINTQNSYARVQADFLSIATKPSDFNQVAGWVWHASLVLQNRGTPYFPSIQDYFTRDTIFKFDQNTKFALKFLSVAGIFMPSGNDVINIEYTKNELITLIPNPKFTLTNSNNYSFTIGSSASTILTANGSRKYLQLQADTSNTGNIWLGFNNAASLGRGAYLTPGGSFSIEAAAIQSSVSAISDQVYLPGGHSPGTNTLYAVEFV